MMPETREAVIVELRKGLRHLYNPDELRCSSLLDILGIPKSLDKVTALRNILQDAIETLKPGREIPGNSNTWRIYKVLTYRYIQQSSQEEVAADLSLSRRQLQRLEKTAIGMLAETLLTTCKVTIPQPDYSNDLSQTNAQTLYSEVHNLETELSWLRNASPKENINISELIYGLQDTLSPFCRVSNIKLKIDVNRDLSTFLGYPSILRQVLFNLIMTTPLKPGSDIVLQAKPNHKWIILNLHLTHVETKVNTNQEKIKLAQQLIKFSGGKLDVIEENKGVIHLQILLPCTQHQLVFVVDDNVDAHLLFERYLTGSRYNLLCFRDPQEMMAAIEERQPAIIILDIMLPGMDGWQILSILKQNPKTKNIPVIISTILPQEMLAALMGAEAFLQKPLNQTNLLALLDQMVPTEKE